jgi:hypothetical protein
MPDCKDSVDGNLGIGIGHKIAANGCLNSEWMKLIFLKFPHRNIQGFFQCFESEVY